MSEFESTQQLSIPEPNFETPKKAGKKSRRPYVQWAVAVGIVALFWAHFIWATYYFVAKTDFTIDETSCSGYGLWMIVFIFINFILLYKFVLKGILPMGVHAARNLLKGLPAPVSAFLERWGHVVVFTLIFVGILAFLIVDTADDRQRLMPLSGLAIYVFIGFLLSPHKKKIPWSTVCTGLIVQFILGALMIRWETGRNIFSCVGDKVDTFLNYAVNASAFTYSEELVIEKGVFAFSALAPIYFMSFFINILYHYGIMQEVVLNLGIFFRWLLGTPIIESVTAAANIFLGMSESPFLLKPYLDHLTRSEIHSVMTSGFASVSGTVLAAYISFGASPAHLITSCVMSAPAALCFSKLMYPETEQVFATTENLQKIETKFESVLDAAVKGASEASMIVIAIIANLICFISFIYFVNGVLGWLGVLVGFDDEYSTWSMELILGKILIPLTYTMGVEWEDCEKVGQLIGIKTIVNEFVAFQKMQTMDLSVKSHTIATYSICGFSNPGSVGIMLSTLGAFMPRKKEILAKLVFRAFLGGCFVCFMTACIAAMLTK